MTHRRSVIIIVPDFAILQMQTILEISTDDLTSSQISAQSDSKIWKFECLTWRCTYLAKRHARKTLGAIPMASDTRDNLTSRELKGRDTRCDKSQVAATRRRDRLLQQIASCDM